MSTLHERPPLQEAATGDILDSLVQDHLQRAGNAPVADPDVAPPPSHPASPPPGDISDEERQARLQREIQALLNAPPTTSVAPPAESEPADADLPDDPATPPIPAASTDITEAELRVLLPETPAPKPAEPAPAAPAPAAPIGNAEVAAELAQDLAMSAAGASPLAVPATPASPADARIADAEAVLAAELSQLLASPPKQDAPPPAAVPITQTAPAPQPEPAAAAPAETPASVEENKEENKIVIHANSEPEPEPAASNQPQAESQDVVAPETLAAAAPAPAADPVAIPEPVPPTLADETDEEEVPRSRISRMFSDVGLMAAQLMDMPFSWLNIAEKNIIGAAALMFLLGGLAIMIWAWWLGV